MWKRTVVLTSADPDGQVDDDAFATYRYLWCFAFCRCHFTFAFRSNARDKSTFHVGVLPSILKFVSLDPVVCKICEICRPGQLAHHDGVVLMWKRTVVLTSADPDGQVDDDAIASISLSVNPRIYAVAFASMLKRNDRSQQMAHVAIRTSSPPSGGAQAAAEKVPILKRLSSHSSVYPTEGGQVGTGAGAGGCLYYVSGAPRAFPETVHRSSCFGHPLLAPTPKMEFLMIPLILEDQ
ncbi:hypothetical protein K435DRAFT_866433 [Dendrothele bispora CBS 962.96]|uniref:Uncharacterized protein n=1 Tax=Dendrothele bispora (strain CBS 962.96) TaxID=1314807 RepID=A0A4S8LGT0_DENBC|nr:hypothetical protein K435DRAFT_866433 [Dendrothele bispora CBS 962.96]